MRRVNTTQYKQALIGLGHIIVDSPEQADKSLVWTCAVRDDFHDNSVKVLKDLEAEGHSVVAAGCFPSINPGLLKKFFKGDVIHYNNDESEFKKVFGGSPKSYPYPVIEAPITIPLEEYKKQHPELKIGNDDQYIKLFISEGCTKKCSYCTEILAFPPYHSYPAEKIIHKAKQLVVRTGVKKLALFGDDIGAYGLDSGINLIELIERLTDIESDIQISLKQIHPLWCLHYHDKLMNFIDKGIIFQVLVPIQSANDRILDLMGRGYNHKDLEYLFSKTLNKPDLELETHVIAGFPTETNTEWLETVNFICKYNFRYVMGNIFMPGHGTEAAEMPDQIDQKEKERRIINGSEIMEKNNIIVGHNLSERSREHVTLEHVDFTEL